MAKYARQTAKIVNHTWFLFVLLEDNLKFILFYSAHSKIILSRSHYGKLVNEELGFHIVQCYSPPMAKYIVISL